MALSVPKYKNICKCPRKIIESEDEWSGDRSSGIDG